MPLLARKRIRSVTINRELIVEVVTLGDWGLQPFRTAPLVAATKFINFVLSMVRVTLRSIILSYFGHPITLRLKYMLFL